MALDDRLIHLACFPEARDKIVRIRARYAGLAMVESHELTRTMMEEVVAGEPEIHPAAIGPEHDLAKLVEELRLAIRSKPHDLVFIPVLEKAEELRERGVKNAERMGKNGRPHRLDSVTASNSPHRAGKVAEPVDRIKRRFFKGRDEEGTG